LVGQGSDDEQEEDMRTEHRSVGWLALVLLSQAGLALAAFPDRMTYQGLLQDGGSPVNGNRNIEISLYNVPASGSPLFTQSFVSTPVVNGVFAVIMTGLGSIAAGNDVLYLGVRVDAGAELTPRQELTAAAYSLRAQQADDAGALQGQPAAAFAPAVHAHSGADIVSGTVAEPRIDAAIARDSEIVPIVLANDGSGSTLDADSLDGMDSAQFVTTANARRKYYLTPGTYLGNQTLTACAAGYHMATFYEIAETSNFSYDSVLGYQLADSGPAGPPMAVLGWVRTGYQASGFGVGANCLAWQSGSGIDNGTVVYLYLEPDFTTARVETAWAGQYDVCNTGYRVWCVQD
jgi:hypothetical protein